MIKSMTGYGKSTGDYNNKKFTVEIKSLNSKGLDLNVRMASIYREKELELRNELSRHLERGKVDVSIYFEINGDEQKLAINKELVMTYHKALKAMAAEMHLTTEPEYMSLILRMPEVMQTQREELDENEWRYVMSLIMESIGSFNNFRIQEGAVLQKEFQQRINMILSNLASVETLADERKDTIRTKLFKALNEQKDKISIDQNRFEQEVIFYLEKLDVTEERVRLRAHCDYFIQTSELSTNEGKKLGFIAQEIGREINTIGSKCNDAEIQRNVVQMKDELEKIKEQVLNIL